jgi:hypothetical protein
MAIVTRQDMYEAILKDMITNETHAEVVEVLAALEKLSKSMATRRDQLPPFKNVLVQMPNQSGKVETTSMLKGNTPHTFILDEFELLDTLVDGQQEPEPKNSSKEPKNP